MFWLVLGLGWAKLVLLVLHQWTPCIRLLTDGIKYLQCLQRKKENISFVLFGLNCFHLGHLVVSVHDRLLTRKNRKLTYRKRKFKVSPRGSPVNSLHYTSLLKKTHPHLDVATCVWADCWAFICVSSADIVTHPPRQETIGKWGCLSHDGVFTEGVVVTVRWVRCSFKEVSDIYGTL